MSSNRVHLQRPVTAIDGNQVSLSPGMAVSVESKTGTRRLIETKAQVPIEKGRKNWHCGVH